MKDKIDQCIEYARNVKGINQIDIVLEKSESISAFVRYGKFEKLQENNFEKFGIRIIDKKKQAVISRVTLDNFKDNLDLLINIVQNFKEDEFLGMPYSEEVVHGEIFNAEKIAPPKQTELIDMALEIENAALDKGIFNTESTYAKYTKKKYIFVGSNGFYGESTKSYLSCYTSVIAKNSDSMEQGDCYKIFCNDPKGYKEIGEKAAEKAKAKLNSKKIQTFVGPAIIDRIAASEFLGHIVNALNGNTISVGMSMFCNKINESCFNSEVTIIDDPSLENGIFSATFDADGFKMLPTYLVKHGYIRNYLLDYYTSKKMNLLNNHRAVRSVDSAPYPGNTNVILSATNNSLEDLIKSISKGIYITDFIGMGVNLLTGNYSRGCSGFMIENGEITFPVNEITLSCNLMDVFKTMIPLSDLKVEFGIDSPSIYLEKVTFAGI